MHPESDRSFEARLDRSLKSLPILPAPRTLLPRVLAEIGRRAALPWYRHAWDGWPRSLQAASFIALALIATSLSYGSWELLWPGAVALGETLGVVAGFVGTMVSSCLAVLRAVPGWVLQLDLRILMAGLALLLALAASCLGVGTFFYRFAYARR
jgi:hypothetical protein